MQRVQVSLILILIEIAWYYFFDWSFWPWSHLEYFLNWLAWLESLTNDLSMKLREKKNQSNHTIMKSSPVLLKIRIWGERPFWFDGRNTIRIGNKGVLGITHGVHECIRRFVIIFTAWTPSHEYTIARWIWRDLISVQRRVNNLSLLTIMNFRQFRVHGNHRPFNSHMDEFSGFNSRFLISRLLVISDPLARYLIFYLFIPLIKKYTSIIILKSCLFEIFKSLLISDPFVFNYHYYYFLIKKYIIIIVCLAFS